MKRRYLVALPVGIIDEATRDGWLRALSLFVNVKSLHSNSKIYNYSCRSLTCKLKSYGFKTNKDTVRKYINFLVHKGLCHVDNGHLVLKGKRKFSSLLNNQKFIDPSCHKIVQVRVYNTFTEQVRNLQSRSILKCINQQIKNIKSKSDPMKVKTVRFSGEKANTDIMMSLDTMAEYMYSSRSTANKVKKFSVDTGLIKSETIGGRELSNTISYEGWKKFQGTGLLSVKTFYYKGRIYEVPRCKLYLGDNLKSTSNSIYIYHSKRRFTKNSTKSETGKLKRDGSQFIDWMISEGY